jgi:hypothetical protein
MDAQSDQPGKDRVSARQMQVTRLEKRTCYTVRANPGRMCKHKKCSRLCAGKITMCHGVLMLCTWYNACRGDYPGRVCDGMYHAISERKMPRLCD